ncbi:hypothetical protein JB92DRAFT_2894882 [Gautieria morchelliformis]|nr:hypothetical protein JB92DRAFT_2894882 [Gautieria morchelliformis]
MTSQSIVRVKPAVPSTGPSSTGPIQLQDFATSLQDVLDGLPLIAGSIYDVEDAQGVKSKQLVDDGRGADLIWVDSPLAYSDLHQSSVSPRTLLGCQEYSEDQPLLMVKFTKFTCGTLAMGISLSHMLADCASCVDLIKEWARVSRGDAKSAPLAITSWERHPGKFFPLPTQGTRLEDVCLSADAIPLPESIRLPTPPPEGLRLSLDVTPPPEDTRLSTDVTALPEDIPLPADVIPPDETRLPAPPAEIHLPPYATPPPEGIRPLASVSPPRPPSAAMLSNWFFPWESLRKLKNLCTPTDPSDWVSTGDCVTAVVWRAIIVARKALLEPGRDVQLSMSADGRCRSKMQPDATKYFGNLLTPFTTTLSQSSLLEGSLASVALACRRALIEQLTEANCAEILASNCTAEAIEKGLGDPGLSWLSSWTKYPLVGDALDFGGGAPFWASTAVFFAGLTLIVPQKDGYLASFMIESEWEGNLHTIDELRAFAEPVTSL